MKEEKVDKYVIKYIEELEKYRHLDSLIDNYLFFEFEDENAIKIFSIGGEEKLKIYDPSTNIISGEKILQFVSDIDDISCDTREIKDKIYNFLKEKKDEKTLEYFVKVDTLLENLSSELLTNINYTHFNFFFKNIAFKIRKNEKEMSLKLYKNNSGSNNTIIKNFYHIGSLNKETKGRTLILPEMPRIADSIKNIIKTYSKKYGIFDFYYNVFLTKYIYYSYNYEINFILKETKNTNDELILFSFYLGVILEIYLKSFEVREDFIHCLAIYENILKLDKDMDCYDIVKILIDLN